MSRRRLIVNADDFGRSAGVNAGIVEAFERGIVTSASLMVRCEAASEAAAYAREHPGLGVGLHVDLGEWAYGDAGWEPVYEVVPLGDPAAVLGELRRQLAAFREIVGRYPTHVDSHQHAHRREAARSAAYELAVQLRIPLRHVTPGVSYCGAFYGQTARGEARPEAIGVEALARVLGTLQAACTEVVCHPASVVDFESAYAAERVEELRTLCDPRARAAVAAANFELSSFADVPPALAHPVAS